MTPTPREPLLAALEALASGAEAHAGTSAPWLDAARRLRESRARGLAAEPCPSGVKRRLVALFASRPAPTLRSLLALVFDSSRTPAAATRGATSSRTLRYAGAGVSLDVRVERGSKGTSLTVALDEAPVGVALRLERAGARPRRVPLDAGRTASVRLPASARGVMLLVVADAGEVARTPEIPLG